MKKDYDKAKSNIVLILAFMTLLFTFCSVFYGGIYNKDEIKINTDVSIQGGIDNLSIKLQEAIPYTNLIDKKYKTAYQNKVIKIDSIHNDIFLTKVFVNSENVDSGIFMKKLSYLYGNELFIVHNSFNVNGINVCEYNQEIEIYNCRNEEYNGKVYTANRDILSLVTNNKSADLQESILFYSKEKNNNVVYYEIYENGSYENILDTFSSEDIEKENITFENYIEKYYDKNRCLYESNFSIIDNNYIWYSTERII